LSKVLAASIDWLFFKGLIMNNLYEFTMKVLPSESVVMPDGLKGAYVACYAAALDYQAALKKGVQAIAQMGYKFDEIKSDVREIPQDSWTAYIASVWPEYADQMPSAEQLSTVVEDGQVFFGPFIGFSS
jgi:hypothetical protein